MAWEWNPDEEFRRLERAAAAGDQEAARILMRRRKRAHAETWEDQATAAARSVANLEEAIARGEYAHRVLFPHARRWRDLFLEEHRSRIEIEAPLPESLRGPVVEPHGSTRRRALLRMIREGRFGFRVQELVNSGASVGISEDEFSVTVRVPAPHGWHIPWEIEDTDGTRCTIPIGPYCSVSPIGEFDSMWVLARPEVYQAIRDTMIGSCNDEIHFEAVIRRREESPDTALVTANNNMIIGSRLAIIPAMEVPRFEPMKIVPRSMNPDARIREAERRYASTGTEEDRARLARLLERAGMHGHPVIRVLEETRNYEEGVDPAIELGPDTPWEQIGGDMSPLSYGGTFGRVEGNYVDVVSVEPVLDAVGAGEASEVGYPFWISEAQYGANALAVASEEAREALEQLEGSIPPLSEEDYVQLVPQARAGVLSMFRVGMTPAPGGWGDAIPEGIRQLVGEENVRDAEDEFMRDVLGEMHGISFEIEEYEDGWYVQEDDEDDPAGPFETEREALLFAWREFGPGSEGPDW